MTAVSVYVVFGSADEAREVGRIAIDERLAACVNILGPIESIYRWNNAIESATEIAAIFKTSDEAAEALVTRIAALHSYDVPCIETWPIDKMLGSYADFIEEGVD